MRILRVIYDVFCSVPVLAEKQSTLLRIIYTMFCMFPLHVLNVPLTCSTCSSCMFYMFLLHFQHVQRSCSTCTFYMFSMFKVHVLHVLFTCSACSKDMFCMYLLLVQHVQSRCTTCTFCLFSRSFYIYTQNFSEPYLTQIFTDLRDFYLSEFALLRPRCTYCLRRDSVNFFIQQFLAVRSS